MKTFVCVVFALMFFVPTVQALAGEVQRDHSGKIWYVKSSYWGLQKECIPMKRMGEDWYWFIKGKWEEFIIIDPDGSPNVEDYIIDGHDCPR